MRIVFMGTPPFAATILEALLTALGHQAVVGVWSQPDRPAGRGRKNKPSAVKAIAEAARLDMATPSSVREPSAIEQLKAWAPDVVIVAAYGQILPQNLLDIPKAGCINVHASLLPQYRGASPVAAAILHGDKDTGVTLMRMTQGLDRGPMFAHSRVPIASDDTTESLTHKLAEAACPLLLTHLEAIVAQTCHATPQPDSDVSYAKLLKKTDGLLDFAQPAKQLGYQIRAMHPWPGAYTHAPTSKSAPIRLSILGAIHSEDSPEQASSEDKSKAGTVVAVDKTGIWIQTGSGHLCITKLKPAGGKEMDAHAWARGRSIQPGMLLGDSKT